MSGEISNRSRLTLEKRHQLIDLNKEFINFDIMFECKSVDATKDFEIIVVNQEQLNTIDLTNLTMKRTKGGYISGNIVADEDKYQNYFLILRSATEEPVEVDLEIKIKQIEPKQPQPQQEQQPPMEFPQQPLPPPLANQILDDEIIYPTTNRRQLVLMVVGLLIIGGAIGYYFWSKNRPVSSLLDDDASSVYSEKSSSSKHSSSSSEKSGLLETLLHKEKA